MAYEPQPLGTTIPRLTMMLWGEAGCGKTTLAATAPGKILWLLLDDNGTHSIKSFPNIMEIDLSKEKPIICNEFKKDDPFGITATIEKHNIDTVVFDSLTRASELALQYVIPLTYKATRENPTQGGYGARNLLVVDLMHNLLRATGRSNTNMIFITHEGSGEKTESGQVLSVSMLLGGQLPNLVAKDIGECWNMEALEKDNVRRIGVRPERKRKPMKSRLFDLSGNKTGFDWKYNLAKSEGWTLSQMWEDWKESGYGKLDIP